MPAARLLLIAFASLAILFQSYAIQTHIHDLRSATAVTFTLTTTGSTASQAGKHDHVPSSNDPDTCPLCHSLYNGQFVTPSLAAYFFTILSVSVIAATSGVSPHYDTVSHSWRGRGPPHN